MSQKNQLYEKPHLTVRRRTNQKNRRTQQTAFQLGKLSKSMKVMLLIQPGFRWNYSLRHFGTRNERPNSTPVANDQSLYHIGLLLLYNLANSKINIQGWTTSNTIHRTVTNVHRIERATVCYVQIPGKLKKTGYDDYNMTTTVLA